MSKKHVWIAKGKIETTQTKEGKPFKNEKVKVKYLGTTTDRKYPKRLSTGRLLYAHGFKKTGSSLITDTKV
jgi:hypothetical protein